MHMQTYSLLKQFILLNWFIMPRAKIVFPVCLTQLKTKHTTSDQKNSESCNLHTHLEMWLQIFIFQLKSNI